MTNEELIDGLYDIKNWHCDGNERLHTLILEAIKALEQEPCDDAISREQAIKQCGFGMTSLLIADCLRKLPSVNPLPKHKVGEWILQPSNKEQGERDFIWWKCSECGQVIYSETEKDRREFHAFCNRCGSKMR